MLSPRNYLAALPVFAAAALAAPAIGAGDANLHPPAAAATADAGDEEELLRPAETALIARRCGGASRPDGDERIMLSDGILICGDGRRVDDPEVRAMVAALSPRIERRVQAVEEIAALIDGRLERDLETARKALSDLERRYSREAAPRPR